VRTIEQQAIGWKDIAIRMGYPPNDGTRVQRAVGLKPQSNDCKRTTRHITYPLAVKIVRACNAYPVDYGV
jgi:hypothetical protein